MKRSVIAIDVDDVLSPINEEMMYFINQRYGAKLNWEDYGVEGSYRGYWQQVWGVGKKEAQLRHSSFVESGALRKARVMEGAVEAIEMLKKSYHLVIVSARFGLQIDDTHHWLNMHFPNVFKEIAFVPLWYKDPSYSKAKICTELNAAYLIDDNVEHCSLAAEEGINGLLFGDYGWNKHVTVPNNMIRVKDWSAVMEFFDDRT